MPSETIKVHCPHDRMVAVDELKLNPKNRNSHPKDQIKRLAEILEYQGWRYPVKVSNQSGFVVSGHGRIQAAKQNGWDEVPVSFQDYDTPEAEYADSISDNSIASWSELDLSGINTDVGDLGPDFNIDLLGLRNFQIEVADRGLTDPDSIPDAPVEPITKTGDLWVLGNHRLLCGDSTSISDVEKLMDGEKADMVFTDPPYGIELEVNYVKRYGNIKSKDYKNKIAGDYGSDKGIDLKSILNQSITVPELFIWGADNYPELLPRGGSWMVWDKSVPAVDGIVSDFELCWSRERHHYSMIRKLWKGAKAREETGQEGKHRTRWGHPTQKPIELALYFFDHWGKKSVNILDYFGGSGTTLIASEKTNRKCYMMEIDPTYCDIIIKRWELFTNRKAELQNVPSKEANRSSPSKKPRSNKLLVRRNSSSSRMQ